MDAISRVLAWNTAGNLILMDGSCLLGYQVKKGEKKGEDSTYIHADL